MYRFFLAGRYTLARPVSYLATVSIGLAVMALIVVWSIMSGFLAETENVLRGSMSDIVVFLPQRQDIVPREAVEQLVREHPRVASVSSRLVRPAIFKRAGVTEAVLGSSLDAGHAQLMVLGIDVDSEMENTDFAEYLANVTHPNRQVTDVDDPFYVPDDEIPARLRFSEPSVVIMGEDVMRSWNLRRGDAIELVTLPDGISLEDQSFSATTRTFVVTGGYNSGHTTDNGKVYIPREDFGAWAGTRHELSELNVNATDAVETPEQLASLRDEIQFELDEARLFGLVDTWRDRNDTWMRAVENERNILFVILGFFLLLVCTISFSVLTMLVQEKVRDIGILSAMGAPAGGIGSMFALVGVYIASLGGALGLGAGVLLTEYINDVKDFVEDLFGIQIFDKTVYAFTEIPTALDMTWNLGIAIVTAVGAVIICLIPAWRAARLDPVEALRHE